MHHIIPGDFHLHSSFSADSDTPLAEMVEGAIHKGFSVICMTEHLDLDYPANEENLTFTLDLPAYYEQLKILKEKYASSIDLRFGIELGLQPHLGPDYHQILSDYPFDFVIGSSHLAHGRDPYYPPFFEGRSEDESYLDYFEATLENLDAFDEMDVYGHIDYVVRYGPNQNRFYSYRKFQEILDAILEKIIQKGMGIECNTGGIKYGLGHPNPCEEILSRYKELGGEILTMGSDAHAPQHIGYAFDHLPELLKSCGFKYYTIFKDRIPEFLPL